MVPSKDARRKVALAALSDKRKLAPDMLKDESRPEARLLSASARSLAAASRLNLRVRASDLLMRLSLGARGSAVTTWGGSASSRPTITMLTSRNAPPLSGVAICE